MLSVHKTLSFFASLTRFPTHLSLQSLSAPSSMSSKFTPLPNHFRAAVSLPDDNKPDFRELDFSSSPVSHLHPRQTPTSRSTSHTTSSSSSADTIPFKPHTRVRSESTQSVNSPPPKTTLFPAGNICPSGKIFKTGMNVNNKQSPVLGTGSGHYGHGSIMRGTGSVNQNVVLKSGVDKGIASLDAEEVKRIGNELYKKGNFVDALRLYDRAVKLSPGNVCYRSNRAAALSGLGRLGEAIRECEEAVKLDPGYGRARQRLGSLFVRLGIVDIARKHICFPGQQPDPVELQKLHDVERHLKKCNDAWRVCDWKSVLRECDCVIAAGADSSPQLLACRAESLLKLQRLEDANLSLMKIPNLDSYAVSITCSKFFGMLSEAYINYVRAQIEMSFGRFDNAVIVAEKAAKINPQNAEIAQLVNTVKLVSRARSRGNELFKFERFTEACSAYGDGLRLDPLNSILYCNRAACWFKIGQWEHSLKDCCQALCIQPSYTKALLRRAISNSKLERFSDAIKDYEVLRKILPDDNEVAKSLFHAQVALRKSRGEEVHNMKFGGEVEEVFGIQQFRAAISSPGVSIVYFKVKSSQECMEISMRVDKLCHQYPLVSFIKVDIKGCPDVADTENVQIVPTFKIYKNSIQLKEMICPSLQLLECSVRHYSC